MAARLGTSEGSVRVVLHRMRQQFRLAVRQVVADTVDSDDAAGEELRYLQGIVGRAR